MIRFKLLLLFSTLLTLSIASAQKLVLQETNIGQKKNASLYLSTAQRCKSALINRKILGSMPYANKCTLTNNDLNALADRFKNLYSKELQTPEGDGNVIERVLANERDQVVKLAYVFLPAGSYTTTNFVQVVVTFEPGDTPKILNLQVKGKDHIGILTFTERELHPPKKVEAQKKVETQKKTEPQKKTAPQKKSAPQKKPAPKKSSPAPKTKPKT